MPRTPETHARLDVVLAAWDALDHERMVLDAVAGMTWVDFVSSSYRPPKEWPTLHAELDAAAEEHSA
jgi:thiamine biosynthesis protein ThiI